MRTGLNPLGAVLRKLIAALELDGGMAAYQAVELWPQVAGPAVAVHAQAEEVRGDVLMVVTDSPVWAHQLQTLTPELLERLRELAGPDCPVRQIRFRSGSPWRNPFVSAEPRGQTRAAAETAAATDVDLAAPGHLDGARRAGGSSLAWLSPGDSRALDQAAEVAGDPQLGDALRRALRAQIGPPAHGRRDRSPGGTPSPSGRPS